MPRNPDIKNVLIIGSGPIIIGQAAEFDYSGTQACEVFKSDGCKVVVLNPNPATIQTETEFADVVYLEPVTSENIEKIIQNENIDSIASAFGGQVALNVIRELGEKGILEKYNVKIIGTGLHGIDIAEDRWKFRNMLLSINEPVALGFKCKSIEDVENAYKEIGKFPLIVRASFTLGGLGTGIAKNFDDLLKIANEAIMISPLHEVIIEQSLLNLQEFEIELIRDSEGNKIAVCFMENIDPMGIHTGESIVVTPSLTLDDTNLQRLRNSAFKIIDELDIQGSCNIQFAIDKKTGEYYVVEVNPRTSRSSALASKATGYPIARIAAKIALGYRLDEIKNPITQKTFAAFEPSLDYVTVKIPRWPFDKFRDAEKRIGMSMKSTGEVMAIGRTFEEALMKAILSLDNNRYHFIELDVDNETLKNLLENPTDIRLFAIGEALRRNWDVKIISSLTKWEEYFIQKIKNIIDMEKELKNNVSVDMIKKAKRLGISDKFISNLMGLDEVTFRNFRKENGIYPIYKAIDTCAGEFDAITPYYYSTYHGQENESSKLNNNIIVLGSGPIRIGQGIEFDYSTVEAVLYLKSEGYKTVVINNNPETVSTDFDLSDKLYFEPLTFEHVANVIDIENPNGIIVQLGGQTSINLVNHISKAFGEKIILGTKPEMIDMLEDRDKFAKFLENNKKRRAKSFTIKDVKDSKNYVKELGYPVLIRPSYVIGGSGMSIIYNDDDLESYLKNVVINSDYPLLIEKYIENAKELDIDVISDGKNVHIMGILEHLEEAGVHSGDSTMVYPPLTISKEIIENIYRYVEELTLKANIIGFINYQIMVKDNEIFFIEANPRASRTVPFLSKAKNIQYAKIGTSVMIGKKLDIPFNKDAEKFYVKLSVFPFNRLKGSDPVLGPEMKSTGEIMGIGKNFNEALEKAFRTIYSIKNRTMLLSLNNQDKKKINLNLLKNWKIYATSGTHKFLKENGIESELIFKLSENKKPNIVDIIRNKEIGIVINTPSRTFSSVGDGYYIRREAIDSGIPIITNLKLAEYVLSSLGNEYNLYPIKK